MAPMYVLVEELDKDHTSVAIRLRVVRTYNVWHSRGRDQIKSKSVSSMMKRYMYRLKAFEVLNTLDANILVAGEVKICSSYDATKLLFNENTLEFVEFRNSLSMQQQTPLKSITSNSTFSYGTTSGVIGDFWVPCKIIGIKSDPNDWYYDSCPKPNCNKKLELNSGMYDCGKCGGRLVKDELKAMQPSVMTKVPKDIRNLKGRENENSMQDENVIGPKHNRLSSIQTPNQFFGVFQSSLVNPLSVLTEGPSRLSNDLTDKNRTPLQDISLTVNMNRERENENSIQDENVIGSKYNRLSSIQTPKQLFGVFQSSLVTPLSVLTEGPSRLSNDLIDKTRAPLQDIPATLNMNRERGITNNSAFQV
nr:replication factor A protein 1-like [Ipomoea batatas]